MHSYFEIGFMSSRFVETIARTHIWKCTFHLHGVPYAWKDCKWRIDVSCGYSCGCQSDDDCLESCTFPLTCHYGSTFYLKTCNGLASVDYVVIVALSFQGVSGGQGPSKEQQEEMARKQEEMKNSILVQILDQPARARRTNSVIIVFFSKMKILGKQVN